MTISSAALLVAALAWAAPAPAIAQSGQVQSPNSRPSADPNQRICEDVTQVGSRLATKKICATRAEWTERRKQDREAVEDMQRLQGRPCVDAMHGTGAAPAC
jgi:hypothetical protein